MFGGIIDGIADVVGDVAGGIGDIATDGLDLAFDVALNDANVFGSALGWLEDLAGEAGSVVRSLIESTCNCLTLITRGIEDLAPYIALASQFLAAPQLVLVQQLLERVTPHMGGLGQVLEFASPLLTGTLPQTPAAWVSHGKDVFGDELPAPLADVTAAILDGVPVQDILGEQARDLAQDHLQAEMPQVAHHLAVLLRQHA